MGRTTPAAPLVLKFGGTSVEDAAAFERVAAIVRARTSDRPAVVVVSALAGVTDALLRSFEAGSAELLAPHLDRHRAIAERLLPPDAAAAFSEELQAAGAEAARLIDRARATRDPALVPQGRDELVSFGERLSASLLARVLAAAGVVARAVDARRCIVTDRAFGRAAPDPTETERRTRAALEPLLQAAAVPVLGGFIAATPDGTTTTLGRGGSDYTAALVGAALGAAEIQIWTDVPGVLTADPRVVGAARTIPQLSYAEASELAFFGAKVLHPKTIQPALERHIPVRIGNSRAPDDAGTLVTADAELWPGAVKSIAHKTGITVLQITSARMLGAYGFLRAVFEVFDRHHMPVDVVTTSEVSLSLTVEDGAALPDVVRDLGAWGDVQVERHKAIICVVGEGLRTTPGIAARVFETIRDINVSLISQGASRVNLTFVVDEHQVHGAVTRLHGALLEAAVAGGAVPGKAVVGPGADAFTAARRPGVDGRRPEVNLLHLAGQLIDIPSVSGDEAAVARFLEAELEGLGYRVELLDHVPGRPGIFATTGAPPRIVFCTHLDTVPPHAPFSEDEAFLYGRGACDAKGILAAQLAAAERLRAEGMEELGLLYVVDEERGSLGARGANTHPAAAECRWLIVGEPTENRLAVGCKGSLRATLRTSGTGGHSAYPERGRSAIDTLLDVLADVRTIAWPRDAYFGETTCNVGVIGGGVGANVIAPEARAELHLRMVTAEPPVRELLDRAARGRAEVAYQSYTPPMRLTAVPGFEQCVVGFTTDVPHLSHWGTPLLLGPGSIHDAHMARERVAKDELARGVEQYVRLARHLVGVAAPAEARP
jgi:aspartate kinase